MEKDVLVRDVTCTLRIWRSIVSRLAVVDRWNASLDERYLSMELSPLAVGIERHRKGRIQWKRRGFQHFSSQLANDEPPTPSNLMVQKSSCCASPFSVHGQLGISGSESFTSIYLYPGRCLFLSPGNEKRVACVAEAVVSNPLRSHESRRRLDRSVRNDFP